MGQQNLGETERAIESIFKLASKQEQLLLLRSCITGRIVHLLGECNLTHVTYHAVSCHSSSKEKNSVLADLLARKICPSRRKS